MFLANIVIGLLVLSGAAFWGIILWEPVQRQVEKRVLERWYRPYQYEFKCGDVVLRDGYYWFVQSRRRWGRRKTYILRCLCKNEYTVREGNKVEFEEEEIKHLAVQNEDSRW